MRACLEPGCPNPATRHGRCTPHARQKEQRRARARGPRIYDTKRWKLTRRRVLFDRPLCEHEGCEDLSVDVHHLETPEDRPDLAYTLSNLEALCHAHHSATTRAQTLERAS